MISVLPYYPTALTILPNDSYHTAQQLLPYRPTSARVVPNGCYDTTLWMLGYVISYYWVRHCEGLPEAIQPTRFIYWIASGKPSQ